MKAEFGLGGYFVNPIDKEEDIIRYAIEELDVSVFDTSPVYGESEKKLGKIIKNYNRDDFYISTKTKGNTKIQVQLDLCDSLLNLNTDYIDIYFGHSFIDDVETITESMEVLEYMNRLFIGSCVDTIGVSGHSPEAAMIAINSGMVGAIMVPHSLIYNEFSEVIKYAQARGIEVYTMKNFASGILLGGSNQNKFNENIKLQDIMNYSAYHGDFIIPAARSIEQLKQNHIAYENAKKLSNQETDILIGDIIEYLGSDICRFCNECRPCPKYGWQMSQPGIIKSLIYQEKFGINMHSQYDKYKLNVLDCGDCNACNSMCPFDINIKNKMELAHNLFNKEV